MQIFSGSQMLEQEDVQPLDAQAAGPMLVQALPPSASEAEYALLDAVAQVEVRRF